MTRKIKIDSFEKPALDMNFIRIDAMGTYPAGAKLPAKCMVSQR
jgi:hypothetical protein